MKVGTKSILFGAHSIPIHALCTALAWRRLYGFPWDPRLWFAFGLHDLGYWARANVDGDEGEAHVELGARLMGCMFGQEWSDFTAGHSRYWSKRTGKPISKLCIADKLAFVMMPDWLYLLMTGATGELWEYMEKSLERQAGDANFTPEEAAQLRSRTPRTWLRGLKRYTARWIQEHRDGRADAWTPAGCPGVAPHFASPGSETPRA